MSVVWAVTKVVPGEYSLKLFRDYERALNHLSMLYVFAANEERPIPFAKGMGDVGVYLETVAVTIRNFEKDDDYTMPIKNGFLRIKGESIED